MEPNIVKPSVIDDVLPVVENVEDIPAETLEQLSDNREDGE